MYGQVNYRNWTIGQDRQELSVPFYDIETKEVNVTAVLNEFQTTFVIITGRFSQSLVISQRQRFVVDCYYRK